jgi:hypothetical protein
MSHDTGGRLPFEGSSEIAGIISDIITDFGISAFVETGTQRGASCKWVAENFPHLYVVTIELNREYFLEAFDNLRHTNITQMIGNSSECLLRLRFRPNERVLFFLDAHGCGTGRTPLLEELEAIETLLHREQIVPFLAIHDFQVPGHPELGYDSYGEQIINTEFIAAHLLRLGFAGQELRFNSIPDGAARGFAYIGFKQAKWF